LCSLSRDVEDRLGGRGWVLGPTVGHCPRRRERVGIAVRLAATDLPSHGDCGACDGSDDDDDVSTISLLAHVAGRRLASGWRTVTVNCQPQARRVFWLTQAQHLLAS